MMTGIPEQGDHRHIPVQVAEQALCPHVHSCRLGVGSCVYLEIKLATHDSDFRGRFTGILTVKVGVWVGASDGAWVWVFGMHTPAGA